MIAAGAYIRALREGQRLSRPEVVRRLKDLAARVPELGDSIKKTNDVQLFRLESGESDSRSSLWMAVVTVLGGNAEHVRQLMWDESASEDQGEQMAHWWLSLQDRSKASELASSLSEDELEEAYRVIGEMRQNPGLLSHALGYLRGLMRGRPSGGDR